MFATVVMLGDQRVIKILSFFTRTCSTAVRYHICVGLRVMFFGFCVFLVQIQQFLVCVILLQVVLIRLYSGLGGESSAALDLV